MEIKQVYALHKVLYRLSSKASNCGTPVPLLLRRRPDGRDRISRQANACTRPFATAEADLMAQSRRIVRAAASKDFSAGRLLITTAIAIMLVLAAIAISAAAEEPDYAVELAAMVRTIVSYSAEVNSATGRDRIAPGVLEAMGIVPRHEFVPEGVQRQAYADRPLPIGYGQTISQPFIVALMTDLLRVGPNDVVLEIGTGSGYQAAVLARLAREVHTIEIIPALADAAAAITVGKRRHHLMELSLPPRRAKFRRR